MAFRTVRSRQAYLLTFPYIAFIALMIIYPTAVTIRLSFTQDEGLISATNYLQSFSDMYFPRIVFNTVVWTISCVGIIIPINIGLALLLNQKLWGRAIFRTIIFVLPWATPDVVAAVEWKWMYNSMYGILNQLLMRIGILKTSLAWLGEPNLALFSVIVANIWKGYPIGTIIMLAALQSIPKEICEAAKIDGASDFKSFIYIIIPQVKITLLTLVLMSVIWTINYFPLIYVMTGGGPLHGTDTLVTYAYRESFSFLAFHKGASIAMLVFVIILIFAIFYMRLILRKEQD